ncbi:MarR family transcriptional regulator [Kribbella antibiotica]|uniref:MarR family transcriptional regulator n=1 Tax=Kribbella antibiotica TaxID=190195 RepID=A0A4R4YYY4_9ACTN|nr:MarR family transcriptional regulator [Kribbella antibiotica]TDD49854.1 MarR family transcriptional regulator [Kribbella antibiotica]
MTDLSVLFTDLVRLETRLYTAISNRLRAEHEISLGQYEFLRYIAERGTCRVYDLAQEMAITVGATSKAVDRLEAAEWIGRTANPDDRRSSLVALTESGRRVLAEATPTFETELAAWFGSALPPKPLAELGTTLSLLRQRAEADEPTARP